MIGGPGSEVGVEPDQQARLLVAELVADDAGLGERERLGQAEDVGIEPPCLQHIPDCEEHVVDTENIHATPPVQG